MKAPLEIRARTLFYSRTRLFAVPVQRIMTIVRAFFFLSFLPYTSSGYHLLQPEQSKAGVEREPIRDGEGPNSGIRLFPFPKHMTDVNHILIIQGISAVVFTCRQDRDISVPCQCLLFIVINLKINELNSDKS